MKNLDMIMLHVVCPMILRDTFGWFLLVMLWCIIPIGFKASPFIYQIIGMVVTSYLQNQSISMVQYIDDRLAIRNVSGTVDPYVEGFKVTNILVKVRLYMALGKCSFVPLCQFSGFLGRFQKNKYCQSTIS